MYDGREEYDRIKRENKEKLKKRRENYLKRHPAPPKIEIIDDLEIYLIKDNKRVRRICGKKKYKLPEGYVCTNHAGYRTNHYGIGRCRLHEPKHTENALPRLKNSLYMSWKRINKKLIKDGKEPLVKTVADNLDYIKPLVKEKENLDNELTTVYNLLLQVLKGKTGKDNLSEKEIEMALELSREVRNIKETQHRINKDMSLDNRVILTFIDELFQIIIKNLSSELAIPLLSKIKHELIVPIGAVGGKEGKSLVSNVEKKIDKKSADSVTMPDLEYSDYEEIDNDDEPGERTK